MTPRRSRWLFAGALLFAAVAMPARADDAAERARIRDERAAVVAREAAAERECAARFAVSDCVETARRQRSEALNRLRGEELVLERAARKQRAAERAEAIRTKQAREEDRLPPARRPPGASADAASAVPVGPRLRLRMPDAPTAAGRPAQAGKLTPEEEARNRERYAERQRAVEEHRRAVERRNAERAGQNGRKPARPLPEPPGASQPR